MVRDRSDFTPDRTAVAEMPAFGSIVAITGQILNVCECPSVHDGPNDEGLAGMVFGERVLEGRRRPVFVHPSSTSTTSDEGAMTLVGIPRGRSLKHGVSPSAWPRV